MCGRGQLLIIRFIYGFFLLLFSLQFTQNHFITEKLRACLQNRQQAGNSFTCKRKHCHFIVCLNSHTLLHGLDFAH